MAPPIVNPIYLQDSGAGLWQVGVTNAGLLTTTVVVAVIPSAPVLTDMTTGQFWQLGVTVAGLLTTTLVPYTPTAVIQLYATDATLRIWQIQVFNGLLTTTLWAPPLTMQSLSQVDTWELDNGQPAWPYDPGTPITWWENTLPQQMVGIAPTPANNGTIGLLYIQLAQTLTNTGIPLTVPDDWTPYILYGTLAELLSSDGPAFDPVRASYCRQRYEEGIELARIVLGGM